MIFPILQFNCGRDVSSQYFISTKMQDCPHFWPPYLSSERSSGNKKSPTLLLTKDISVETDLSSPAIRRRPKQTLSLARLPAGRPHWWTGRFWKRKNSEMFFNTLIQIFPDSSSMRQPFHFILMIIGKCSEEEKNGKVWSFAKLVGGVSEGSKKPSL